MLDTVKQYATLNIMDDAMNFTVTERDLAGCADSRPYWLTTCDCGECTYERGTENPCECAKEGE